MDRSEFSPEPESLKSAKSLAADLGFVESTELYDLRLEITREFLVNPKHAIELKAQYQTLAEQIANSK